ncbi:MAG TPA: hypothetical protein VL354_21480 [Spirochaetia bacterium]|nr:hypothetical protein [Spirochaetia bacterium]
MTDFDTFTARWEQHRQQAQAVNDKNKETLFAALAATNITTIRVDFDGEGDSGQINNIDAFAIDTPSDLPAAKITIQRLHWGDTVPVSEEIALEAAIESLCYDFLEQEHGGWENNDGGYGEFTISVPDRTIELEFHARYTDTQTYTHSF